MSRLIVQCIFLVTYFVHLDCEIYQDRPKIKTSDGDLILEPAFDKNVYLLTNGPKSSIFVGEVNLLNMIDGKPTQSSDQNVHLPNSDLQEVLNGPNGILQRLEKLESQSSPILPDDLFLNISTLWRKVNNLHRKVHNLQILVNSRGRDECQSNPCQHGGTCLNLVNGYHCLCPSNWEGKDCDSDVNECRNFAGTDLGCQNGAACINKPGYYECVCRTGWYGQHCTRKSQDCSEGDFEMCGHGTCLSTHSGITCLCHQGWTTNGTGVACSTDVNECDSQQGARCSVNPRVECINLPGSFRCGQCPPGYDGDGYVCADINECTTLPNGGCSPMVACHNTIGSRICGPCPQGYQGDGVTCSWRGSCNINHGGCHPSAQCIESLSTAQCICPDGMEGDGVGINGCYISTRNNFTKSCVNNPCGPHGQCHMLRSGYTCICQQGYGGAHCDAPSNICGGNPCHNGGRCRPDETSTRGFRCECTAQYSGTFCQVRSQACGGVLDAEEGSIVYPLTNTTYNHNVRCAWVIHVIPSKVINVTFSKFNLEVSPECLYDFLQIHDGRSSASQLIGRFCGDSFPIGGNIISTHNNLYFWFRSDSTVAKEGFALHWTSIVPVCGGEIDAKLHGHISSPGSPSQYPPNRDCYWHLTTNFGKRIQLHFFALDIETHPNCSFDYLAVYDGMRTTDPLLNKYCNSTQPAPLQSAGSEILIHFHSDAYGSGNGFQLAYAPVEGVPGCGGYYTTEKGEITSPSYNGSYLNNLLCEYKIKTSPDTKVRIDFKQFKLERSIRCRFDYLKIYDGPSAESPLVGKFCGTTYPKSYTASSNEVFFRFKTDLTVPSEGFKISYQALCQMTLHGDSGIIKSPGYPFSYPENRVCEYIIKTTPGKAIQLTFQDFDIEDNRYYSCQYDHVEIRDGLDSNSTLLGKYCGGSEHMPPVLTSTHNYMYIKFNSDMSITGTGFFANYTTIDVECGGVYTETTGLINYPSGDSTTYNNDRKCTWILVAPAGMHIKLTWNRFDIENMPSCDSDYLELIEVDNNNENNNMGRYCGTKTPPALTTSTNYLMMKFESDASVRSTGFSVSYTFLDEKSHCGGVFFKTHGFIYSPGWPNRYEPNRDCTWTITVPVGQQIRLNISQFDLERPIRGKCNFGDFLEIRNGASQNAALIGKYCGSFQTKRIISLTNTLFLHFHSDYYLTGNGFKLEWDGSLIGCGGTLTSSTGSISSPNYPESYNENTECFYRIATSLGSRIHISFTDLELERTSNCRDDYIEIFDGRDTASTSLGKHCYMSAGSNNFETSSNYAFIKFRSDSYIGGKGFLLNYYTVCNNNLTGRYGAIESPDYPNNYPQQLNCLWTINVPKGNKINVTFTHFDVVKYSYRGSWWINYSRNRLHAHSICNEDYLQWKETGDTNFSDKFCGMAPPPPITTKGNSLQIKFSTGGIDSRTGFRLEWVNYGCGGHIQKRSGLLSVDKFLLSSEELECEWLIETYVGTSVSLIIADLFLTESQNCTKDAIEIYNGQNVDSPLITKVCHHHTSSVQSTSNFMLVKFKKRSTLKNAFFLASFSSSVATCGGNIDSLFGYIHSKNYPKNYDINLDCTWYISVPVNHRINLNFMDIDLYNSNDEYNSEVSSNCGDSIKIYDTKYLLRTNYTDIICPGTRTKQIITTNNKIMVQFTSDSYGNAKGFKANFSVTCGAVIVAVNDGIISNNKYIGGSNKSCTWTILTAPDQKISLTITHLFLPKLNSQLISNITCWPSYLKLFDGNDINAPLIDEYCGRKAPPMIVSRGSALTILLGSYNDNIEGHFSAHYSSLSEACGGTLTSEEGSIASPYYPRSYPAGADCEWILSTSPGNRVYLSFERFDLEYSEGCNEDYLEIRENNGIGPLLGVYCGTDIPVNTTIATKLYIRFHSNDKNNGQGFLLHYGFLHGSELINMESGEVASPLYPNLYRGSGEYSWRILTNGPKPMTISIDALEIPSYSEICSNKLSIYDGYDDTAPLLDELCGKLPRLIEILRTSSNVAYLKLSVDESNSGALFHLKFEKLDTDIEKNSDGDKINCGSNYTEFIPLGNYSNFHSPNYPNDYNNDLNCEWMFRTSTGRHLSLKFLDFNLEETNRCYADFVNIYTSDTPGEWKTVQENICESESAMKEKNFSSYIKIKLKTDTSVTRKGFTGQVSSVCGGTITDLSGEVGPVWNDVHVGPNIIDRMKCEWTLKVRPGRVIKFKFIHLNITNKEDNCLTSVTLRNGNSIEAPILEGGKYCGYSHEQKFPSELTTSSNYLFISYASNFGRFNARKFQNFKIHYEEKSIECGLTSRLDVDQNWEIINSPNYPSPPVPYSECVWTLTGPPGEILRIDFIDRFDLDTVDECGTEVVEIRDGSSNMAPLKGRFCGENPGTIKTSGNAIYVKYITQLSEPRNGFKANISIDICGGTIVADNGEVKSPGYPHMAYIPYGSICEWHIRGSPRFVFNLNPADIDLPESETPCATKISIEEMIPANNTITILREFCDETRNEDYKTSIETSMNEVVIKLSIGKPSEWSQGFQHRGFRLTFNSSRPMCGGTITTPEGYLTTPGYPQDTALRYCQWYIIVPDKTRKIRLELLDLNEDKHTIGLYNDNTFQSLIHTIPDDGYSPSKRVFESSGNKLALFLWLQPLASRHRFKAKFSSDEESLCGGDLSGLNGELSSPNLNRSYNCEWHYNSNTVDENSIYSTIFVTVSINTSVPRNLCRYSDPKLNIKSSITKQGMTFYRDICGITETSFRIPASVIDIKATKSQRHSLNFHVTWKSQPCGGVINVGESPVNILESPQYFNDTLDCAWIITMPFNNRVELKMDGDFQFDCDNEFIKIGNGMHQFALMIGEYCQGKKLDEPLMVNFRFIYIQYHTKSKNSSSIKLTAKTVKSQCGGQLTNNFQNEFVSPNYPKNYEPNQECSWVITADLGSRVSLHFIERFAIEEKPNCTKDAVIIYDWKNDEFNEIARLCGRQLPIPYNSTYNKMKVVLHTDATTNMDGFKANWSPICGGEYIATVKKQILYSPGFPFGYHAMTNCTYTIIAPNDKKLLVQFLEFELEGNFPDCEYDNVTISGNSYTNYLYEIYCGNKLPSIVSNYEKISIIFKTDKYLQRKGFKFSYMINECGGSVLEPTVLTSHIGDNYDNNMNCTWSIQASVDKLVVLKFLFIELESAPECYNDYVAVYDDLFIDNDKRLSLMCGYVNSTTVIRSHGNKALINFVTDHSYNYKGFKVEVLFSYKESVGCGGRIDLAASSKKLLKSFLLGTNTVYENYLDCFWIITSPEDTVVKIEFTSFHISPCRNVNQTAIGYSNCNCDFVEIKDGINPDSLDIGTYCGHTLPPDLYSSGNLISLRFSTDGEIGSSGFEARLTVQQSVCGQSRFTISDTVKRLKSPGYDKGIVPRGIRCNYYFNIGDRSGAKVRISILNLDLQASGQGSNYKCNRDKLIIANDPVPRNFSLGKDFIMNHVTDTFFADYLFYEDESLFPRRIEFCGNNKPADFYVSDSLTITLITSPESDSSVYKGFELEVGFTGFCGRNYTDTQGKIQTEYYSNEESNIDDCYTLISAPENHTISAYFISVIPDFWNDNTYLDIFDGNNTSAAKLITIKEEYDDNHPVFSTGRYLLLHNHRDSNDHIYYDMNYVTTDKGPGCGGKLMNEIGRVTSPKYPDIYRQKSTCEWHLETPVGTHLKLHFSAFDLGRRAELCGQNYLQLVDSKGNVISTYCTENPADYTSSDNFVKIIFFTSMNNGGTGWVADFVGIK